MARKYGSSLKWRIVFMHYNQHMSPQQIIRTLSLGKTFVHSVLKRYRETKGVEGSTRENRGRHRKVDGKELLLLLLLVERLLY